MIFDTHAHYDDHNFDEDREAILASLSLLGVSRVVNAAASMESVQTTLALAKKVEFIYAALGVHPEEIAGLTETDMETLRTLLLTEEKAVAVGEIGLDYYWKEQPEELQKKWFVRQLELAREVKKPVIVHSREAAKDTYDILRNYPGDGAGIVHCFSYSKEMARQFLDLGYYIGLGGVVTFKNSRNAKEVAAYVPMDRLLLETDCPYMAPVPYRGKRNFSGYLPEVAQTIAALRETTAEEIIRRTYENACRLYRIRE